MKKVMDKKGQFSQGYLMWLIIGIVAVVLVLFFSTDAFGKISDVLGFAPDDLSSASLACVGYSSQESLALDFCKYRELNVGKKKQWMNCNDVHDKAVEVLGVGKVEFSKQTCGNQGKYCEDVLLKQDDYDGKDYVNGVRCNIPTSN